jgi:hypothetical protein
LDPYFSTPGSNSPGNKSSTTALISEMPNCPCSAHQVSRGWLTPSGTTSSKGGRLTSIRSLPESKVVESIGEFEIAFEAAKPSRTVQTSGDWTFAWNRTARAIELAFPPTGNKELADYIHSLFGAKRVSTHPRIVEMDKAIRKYVGESNDVDSQIKSH